MEQKDCSQFIPEVESQLNSPVQEHHIDFLLEEEFACNPKFLSFFLSLAKKHLSPTAKTIEIGRNLQPNDEWNCKSVRSVTTEEGETDVLVIYSSAEGRRVAILIENKIRAHFQPNQANRYRIRGEAGGSRAEWDLYWTCLISPKKYANGNEGFDSRIHIEELLAFFDLTEDRSRFKAGVFHQVLRRFHETGLQKKDDAATKFRLLYAEQAAYFFGETDIDWPQPRDAWWDDTWFNFKIRTFPKGLVITYKARPGFVDLSFSQTNIKRVERFLQDNPQSTRIVAAQTGKSASFRIHVSPIPDIHDFLLAGHSFKESLEQVLALVAFYKANAMQLNDLLLPLALDTSASVVS